MSPAGWTDWQPLALSSTPDPGVLAETVDGGQAFRWERETSAASVVGGVTPPRDVWQGQWDHHLTHLRLNTDGHLEWRACLAATGPALVRYLDGNGDPRALADSLPWRSDAHLARCLAAFPGLRILRQPFGETLLGFLCSATKQIVQIKQMMALLAERHGAPLRRASDLQTPSLTTGVRKPDALPYHRLPTWDEIAAVPEAELRKCLLGFRARYIHQTAQFIAAHPGWLEETEALPYIAAKARLMSLPGVGEKVADCVLLFGAGKLEAFPVDVWILKTMERRYGLDGWKPAQVAQFGRAHFGPLAGLAQQYLFAWERAEARKTK